MQTQTARRLVPTATSADEQHRIAVDLHRSRQSLIATLLRLRPDDRTQVLEIQDPDIRKTHYWSYEGLEACCQRLRTFEKEHSDPGLSRILAQAQGSRREMNRAREALIMANLGIVPHVVKEYFNGSIPMNDLIQDGYLGLLRAVDRFDPYHGAKFSTYAAWWIRRALGDAFTERARLIRLPEAVRRDLRRCRETKLELKNELERQPTNRELARRTGLTVKKIQALQHVAPDASRLEDLGNGRSIEWQTLVADEGACDPFKTTLKGELQDRITRLMGQLQPRERRIIEMRFGFEDGNGRTLQQIARLIGVSRERVRQVESTALEKMNRWVRRDRILNC